MNIRTIITGAVVAAGMFVPLLGAVPAGAQSSLAEQKICEGSGGTYSGGKCTTAGQPQTVEGTFNSIINTLLFIVGAVSVIMLIIGGIRYVVSGGDQAGVNSAKNTILYAVIGLIVAFAAYGIVNFVVESIL